MSTYDFTDVYSFDSNAGIVMPDTDDVKSRVEEMMKSIFGSELDVTEETPVGRIIEMITVLITQTLGVNAQNANQYNLNTTSGIYLDSIGRLFGLSRKSATPTRVLCTVSGTPGTVIPTTAIAETVEGYKFSPENPITIGEGGGAQGYFLSLETGAIPCDQNTLIIISNGVIGWESVVNDTESGTIYGTYLETDVAFRDRILDARANGSASVQAIMNAIYNISDTVSSCYVLENGYSQSIVKKGITLPPHTIYVCVLGGSDEDVAKAIMATKTAGAGFVKSAGAATLVDKEITDGYTGATYHVYFFRPIETPVSFAVSVNRYLYSGSDLVGDIQKNLMKYVSEIGIGKKITREGATSFLANAMPSIRIDNLRVKLSGGSFSDEIALNGNRVPTVVASNIEVLELYD